MREHVKADEPFVREDVTVERGARALPRRGPGLQGRAHRGPRSATRASRPSPSTPTARSPTSAAARTRRPPSASRRSSCSRSPARTGAATPAARCSRASTAPRSSPRRTSPSTSSASSRPARATTASSAASWGCSRSREVVARARRSGCPPGTTIFNELVALSRARWGPSAATPRSRRRSSTTSTLWKTSGHWGKYRENMFVTESEDRRDGAQADELPGPRAPVQPAAAGPTATCRCATPSRACCTATSRAGTLHGLLRVRHFAQDDAHIFCTEEQIPRRGRALPGLRASRPIELFGFEPQLELSTRPEQRIGTDEMWDRAEAALAGRARRPAASTYELNEGDGAFYGPKIDLHMTDSLGRSWQLGTVQLDYSMPERFDLTYTGADNAEHRAGDDPPRAAWAPSSASSGSCSSTTPASCRSGWRRCRRSCCRSPTATTRRPRAVAARCAPPGVRARGRRAHRVGRAQDPRRRAAQGPLHARRRRSRGRGRHRRRAASTASGDSGSVPVAELVRASARDATRLRGMTAAYTALALTQTLHSPRSRTA